MTGTTGWENGRIIAKNITFDYTGTPPRNGVFTADGQLLIGSTANPDICAVANTLTAGPGISITNGPGTITIGASGSGSGIQSLTTDVGGPVTPNGSGQVDVTGTNVYSSGSVANTLTLNVQGTQYGILVTQGSNTPATTVGPSATSGQVLQSQGPAANPAFSTATYPSTTAINTILYSTAADVIGTLAPTARAVLTTNSSGVPTWRVVADGQLIIGSSSSQPIAANLTAGSGISITNGANSITIAVNGSTVGQTITGDSGGPLTPTAGNWNILGLSGSRTAGSGSTITVRSPPYADSTAATLTVNSGTFATAAGTYTLPASPAVGDLVEIVCITTGIVVTANTGQEIQIAGAVSSTAGTATNSAKGDVLCLRYRVTDTAWYATSVCGVWTLA